MFSSTRLSCWGEIGLVNVTLIYPFFKPFNDNSIFRFPPLGLGYIAASLRKHGVNVNLVDCTFLTREEAVARVKRSQPDIIGFYSMFSVKKTSIEMAEQLREDCNLLVVGGPLPTLDPTLDSVGGRPIVRAGKSLPTAFRRGKINPRNRIRAPRGPSSGKDRVEGEPTCLATSACT